MTAPRLSISLTFALLILLAAASVRAEHCCVEDLSIQLQGQVGQLSAEIRASFRHARNFPHLVSDAQQLYGLAAQTRALSRARVNPRTIEDLVHRMDRLVHCLEDRIADANDFHGQIHYGRPIHCDTRHAERLLAGIDRTLEQLDREARELTLRGLQPRYDFDDSFGVPRQVPTGGYYNRSSGLTFGGRGISVQIGR